MGLNAITNLLILMIQMLDLTTECQGFGGIFCSSIRHIPFIQYFKIIVGEYVCNVLRLMSNFTYVAFSLNRLSLVGKSHGKLVVYVSSLTVRKYLTRVMLLCLILSVVKIFRYHPNFYSPDETYPTQIIFLINRVSFSLMFVYLSFNLLFDFINYIAFLIFNLVVDVLLVVALHKTMTEKLVNQINNRLLNPFTQDEIK